MKEAIFTKSISINLSDSMFQEIKEITDFQKISISEFFRHAAELTLKATREDNKDETKQGGEGNGK